MSDGDGDADGDGRAFEQLAHFAGQVSHDLRNPLMTMSGFIEIVSDSPELERTARRRRPRSSRVGRRPRGRDDHRPAALRPHRRRTSPASRDRPRRPRRHGGGGPA
ncbi:hypothetical protein ELQ92_14895 [Labedella populi]|uniref:histidine kinase n=1 Tax=Labedella populi TaxID=2498850 RepID=A0A444Q3E9_9MICO|nr:hypothetical protein ELQ92_14895 [Labedella populi]